MPKPDCVKGTVDRENTHVKTVRERVRSKWLGVVDSFEKFKFFPKLPAQLRNDIRTEVIGLPSRINTMRRDFELALWEDLSEPQKQQAAEIIFARDQVSRIRGGKGNPEITLKEAQTILKDIEAKNIDVPVVEAAERWRDISEALRADLVRRKKLSPEDSFGDYAPHLVIDYVPEWAPTFGVPNRLRRPFRGYVKKAKGSVKEFRQDAKTMIDHMLAVTYDNAIEDFIIKNLERYDEVPKLTRQQKIDLFGITTTKKGVVRLRQPRPNQRYQIGEKTYRAYNPDEPYTRQIFHNEAGQTVIGGRKKTYLIDEPIYEAFKSFSETSNRVMFHINQAVGYWKGAAILSHFPSFNANNLIGDTIMALMQHPDPVGLMRNIDNSIIFLIKKWRKKPLTEAEIKLDTFVGNESIIRASFSAEIPKIAKSGNPLVKFLEVARDLSEFREDILRIANAKWLLEQSELGNANKVKSHYSWIDTKGLADNSAMGKIAREILIDYQAQRTSYRRLIRGLLLPFATWYHKGSQLTWKFASKHPIKAFAVLEALPVLSAFYNNRDEETRKLELQLPDYYQDSVHFTIGKNPDGTIRVFRMMTPFDALIGTKVFSIATNQMNLWLNGGKSVEEAAVDTIKRWGVKEAKGIAFLLNPAVRFIKGMSSGRDPFDNQPLYPTDPRKISGARRKYYESLYFIKTMNPMMTAYLTETKGKLRPADLALKNTLKNFAGKEAFGIRDVEPKVNLETRFGPVDYNVIQEIEEFEAKEEMLLIRIEEGWIKSGMEPEEYAKTKEVKDTIDEIKNLYGDEFSAQVAESINTSIENRMNDPRNFRMWIDNKIEAEDDPEKRKELIKLKGKAKAIQMMERIEKKRKSIQEKIPSIIEGEERTGLFDVLGPSSAEASDVSTFDEAEEIILAGENAPRDPTAINRNRDGTQDTGLFQINDSWLDDTFKLNADGTPNRAWEEIDRILGGGGLEEKRSKLLDPEINRKVAKVIFNKSGQGINAWFGATKELEKRGLR